MVDVETSDVRSQDFCHCICNLLKLKFKFRLLVEFSFDQEVNDEIYIKIQGYSVTNMCYHNQFKVMRNKCNLKKIKLGRPNKSIEAGGH